MEKRRHSRLQTTDLEEALFVPSRKGQKVTLLHQESQDTTLSLINIVEHKKVEQIKHAFCLGRRMKEILLYWGAVRLHNRGLSRT